jgi:hypothetical protein
MLDTVALEIQKQERLARLRGLVAKQDKFIEASRRHRAVSQRLKRAGYETSAMEAQRRAARKIADARALRPAMNELRAWLRSVR